jgi:hypothetical protein
VQAVGDELEIGDELARLAVGARIAYGHGWKAAPRELAALLDFGKRDREARLDEAELAPPRLALGARVLLARDFGQERPIALDRRFELGVRRDVAVRQRERRSEIASAGQKTPYAPGAVRADRIFDHLGRDERIAVHVAAHPRMEPHRNAVRRRWPFAELELLAVRVLESARELLRKDGKQIPEDLLDVPDDVLHLVADGGPLAANLVGLPERGDLVADVAGGCVPFRRRELAVVAVLEDVGDAVELLEKRAARRLARVGGQSEGDLERRDGLSHARGRHARLFQREQHRRERPALRRGPRGVGPSSANAVVLLGDVHEAKIEGKGADDRLGLRRREAAERLKKRPGGVASFVTRPAAPRNGKLANALLERKELFALELDEHLAEQTSEPAHVPPERAVDFATAGDGAPFGCGLGAGWHQAPCATFPFRATRHSTDLHEVELGMKVQGPTGPRLIRLMAQEAHPRGSA